MELGSLQELGRWQLSWPLWDAIRALGVTHPVLPRQGCPEAAIGFSLVWWGHQYHPQQQGCAQGLSASSTWHRSHQEEIQGGCGSRCYCPRPQPCKHETMLACSPIQGCTQPGQRMSGEWGAWPQLALSPGPTLLPCQRPQCTCASRLAGMARHLGLSLGMAGATRTDSRSGCPSHLPFCRENSAPFSCFV